MSQISLVMVAAGTALSALGTPLLLILSAIICGGGGAVSTPASSHLLARVSSPRYLPLVFSIKQTAVPAGLLLAGAFGPLLTEWKDWRFTMLLSAAACMAFALMLQPLCKIFDIRSGADAHFQDVGLQIDSDFGACHATASCAVLRLPGLQRHADRRSPRISSCT